MGTYIVYRLDGTGRIRGAEWLTAIDDRFALEGARSIAGSRGWLSGCEVWQRDRKIGRVALQAARDNDRSLYDRAFVSSQPR